MANSPILAEADAIAANDACDSIVAAYKILERYPRTGKIDPAICREVQKIKKSPKCPAPEERQRTLTQIRNLKMARSAHAYVRGSTGKFYEWLETLEGHTLPEGPPIWICGDCHVGNLGPVANADGEVEIQIRDFDQTVIGNPAHDLIRLGLSLASAARGSDLPGVTTARMLEQLMEGYEHAFDVHDGQDSTREVEKPAFAHFALKQAVGRSWKQLANDRIEDTRPVIALGKRFWPLSEDEKRAVKELFKKPIVVAMATQLKCRKENATIRVLDSAYWVKGCSSLGRLRLAVLLGLKEPDAKETTHCLIDIKEAIQATAPRYPKVEMPRNNAERVVAGARALSPYLGQRMTAERFLDRAVFMRELLPQDLKLEVDRLTCNEAMKAARFLATVVGKAHARQMDRASRTCWQGELNRNRSKSLDAPSWLWASIVALLITHERGYLEHCRRYAMETAPA